MAGSKFEYVRAFEADDKSLPNTWIVIRLDGRSFHKFSSVHKFAKPNDDRALNLMTCAAHYVMCDFRDIVLAYGQSDEYSFVFSRNTKQFNRRASKLVSNVVSLFTSAYVFYWSQYFGDERLAYAPSFDGRVVLYPTDQNLKDYLSWRQADCHINNLYNTCFWSLVQSQGLTPNEAQQRLKDTVSSDKNELLFSQFGINYNSLPELYRKGTILLKQPVSQRSGAASGEEVAENKPTGDSVTVDTDNISTLHCDIIGNKFWTDFPHILNNGR